MHPSTRNPRSKFTLLLLTFGAFVHGAFARPGLTVEVDEPGHPASLSLWGIFPGNSLTVLRIGVPN